MNTDSIPTFSLTLDVSAQSGEVVTAFAVAHLRAAGYHVAPPNENWETPSCFLRRNQLSKNFLLPQALEQWKDRGHPIPVQRTKRCLRIMELQSNPAFDAFCRRNKL